MPNIETISLLENARERPTTDGAVRLAVVLGGGDGQLLSMSNAGVLLEGPPARRLGGPQGRVQTPPQGEEGGEEKEEKEECAFPEVVGVRRRQLPPGLSWPSQRSQLPRISRVQGRLSERPRWLPAAEAPVEAGVVRGGGRRA